MRRFLSITSSIAQARYFYLQIKEHTIGPDSAHWTDVRLDKGGGTELHDGDLMCTRHGTIFEPGLGTCTHGPCEGAHLEEVDVTVHDGGVYLTDDDYDFEDVGPKSDLSSGRIGFGGS